MVSTDKTTGENQGKHENKNPNSDNLDENMHCKECDVWVNSETQMKQHLGSLRHKNTIAGIPVPPRPDKVEPVKPRSNHQYKCELCNVTLNSEVQLLQHLRSQRHKATLEGKPPKPRWVPYERFREQQRIQAKLVSYDIIFRGESADVHFSVFTTLHRYLHIIDHFYLF